MYYSNIKECKWPKKRHENYLLGEENNVLYLYLYIMKKIILVLVSLVVWWWAYYFFTMGTYWLQFSEKSFKGSFIEPRFVRQIVKTDVHAPVHIEQEKYTASGTQYFNLLNEQSENLEKILNNSWINEIAYLFFDDFGNYGVTAVIDQWKFIFYNEIKKDITPTLSAQISTNQLNLLLMMIWDGQLDNHEELAIADFLLVPLFERLYQTPALYEASNISRSQFDNIMQFEIKTDKPVDNYWYVLELAVTVVNADGQMFVKKWKYGNPDALYSFSYADALELYKMITLQLSSATNDAETIRIATDIFMILQRNKSFERADHLKRALWKD